MVEIDSTKLAPGAKPRGLWEQIFDGSEMGVQCSTDIEMASNGDLEVSRGRGLAPAGYSLVSFIKHQGKDLGDYNYVSYHRIERQWWFAGPGKVTHALDGDACVVNGENGNTVLMVFRRD